MKMYCIFICIFSMNLCSLEAYLYVAYGLKSPFKKIFLLGCDHKMNAEIDDYQFHAMIEIISETERRPSNKKTKIFIEYPDENIIDTALDEVKAPINGLIYSTKDLDLQKTSIEDCEIRKVSGAAHLLLASERSEVSSILRRIHEEPFGRPLQWLKRFGCRLEMLTFQDLFDNHAIWMRQCELYKNSWQKPSIRKVFDLMLRRSLSGLEMLREKVADAEIDLNEKVWRYSWTYWGINGHKPRALISGLVTAFADFLDMYTLHRILLVESDSDYDTIIACTGSYHSLQIYEALKAIGFHDIVDPIVDDTRVSPPQPLSYDYLSKVLMPIEELEATMSREALEIEGTGGCILM